MDNQTIKEFGESLVSEPYDSRLLELYEMWCEERGEMPTGEGFIKWREERYD